MTKIIVYGILLYLLYKLVFELVIPVGKATSQVKDKIREMQMQQEAQQRQYQQQQQAPQHPNTPTEAGKTGDYIEFEEVK